MLFRELLCRSGCVVMEHLLQRDTEDLRYPESNFERRGVLVALVRAFKSTRG